MLSPSPLTPSLALSSSPLVVPARSRSLRPRRAALRRLRSSFIPRRYALGAEYPIRRP